MKIGGVDIEREVLVVAEVGNNHEGDYARAEEMVHQAASTGAQAVKFQIFRTEHFVSALDSQRFAQLRSFELDFDRFAALCELAHSLGLAFISTPLDLASAQRLASIADAIKIASGDIDFYPLLRQAAASEQPLILSTGLSDPRRLQAAVECVEAQRGAPADPGMALLHCVSSYPASPQDLNLAAIGWMQRRYPYPVGYSDHCVGVEASVAAVAAGARVIEKHFTLEGIESDFHDHVLSATPPQMKELVERVRSTAEMLGAPLKQVQESERAIAAAVSRSVAAARDLDAGSILAADDLTWVRPGGGIAPDGERELLGRRLRRSLALGEQIRGEDVE